ncbi:hypothetical protein HPB50_027758 [Hyalomma asiaticum]|nr:hypothetical protein HPB50_027758 [Hyalomma asiaticum]
MYTWNYVPTEQCVNCRKHDSNEHALRKCRFAATFWSLVGRAFHSLGVGRFVKGSRCGNGALARLVLAANLFPLGEQAAKDRQQDYSGIKQGRQTVMPHRRRPKATRKDEDTLMLAAVVENPFQSARQVREQLDVDAYLATVRRRLRSAGLQNSVAARKPVVTASNKKSRVQFTEAHASWMANDWGRVIFSDESNFITRQDQRHMVRNLYSSTFDFAKDGQKFAFHALTSQPMCRESPRVAETA